MGPYFNGSPQSNKPIQFRQALASPPLSPLHKNIIVNDKIFPPSNPLQTKP